MSYQPIVPLSPSLIGLVVRDVPLLTAAPQTNYSVIIPLYNKERTIKEVIESVKNQTKKAREIIVINDSSSDKSYNVVKDVKGVTLLSNGRNLGKAESINRALEKVETPYVLILDGDTLLEKNFVHQAMLGFYKRDVKGVCGLVLPSNPGTFFGNSRLVEYLFTQRTYKQLQSKVHGIWVLTGCATLWRTNWIKRIGMPNDTVVEDMDITWEAQEVYTVNYNPKAICYTEEPATFKDYWRQIRRWFSWTPVVSKHLRSIGKGLLTTLLWSIGESVALLLWLGFLVYSFLTSQWIWFISLLGVDLLIISSIAMYEARKYRLVRKAIRGIPKFFVLRFVNAFMYYISLIRPLKKWRQ